MSDAPPLTISEAAFQQQFIDLAHWLGWLVAHFRPARTAKGWRTPVAADGKGFPDNVLCRERTIYVELKCGSGRPSPEQKEWIAALKAAGEEVYVWCPSDWDLMVSVLTRKEAENDTNTVSTVGR